MPGTLPSDALAYALLASAAFAGLDLAQKWTARYAVTSPDPFLALRLLGGAAISPLLLLLPGNGVPILAETTDLFLLALILTNLLGNVLYLKSVYRTDISVLGSLWPLKNFYLPFLALVSTGERFSSNVYALLAVATLGAFGIAYNQKMKWKALTDPFVLLMAGVTVPIFAISDILFGIVVSGGIGARWATVMVSWGIAAVGIPFLVRQRETKEELNKALRSWRGQLGTALTGLCLVIGVFCIGEAFRRAQGVVLVNVFAMSSGLFILLVNVLLPGQLDGKQDRSTYLIRFIGALILVGSAWSLLQLK